MGLDITAYSNLKHVGFHTFDPELNEGEGGPWCYYENHVQAYAYECFTASFRGIPILRTHSGSGHSRFIEGGCYEITDLTETHAFPAGSYGGYNHWRSDLAGQFNPVTTEFGLRPSMTEPDPEKPFYELIWFADNEGTIGSEAARDLLADFREHAERYSPPASEFDVERWRQKYRDWTRAFELAADSGLVRFH